MIAEDLIKDAVLQDSTTAIEYYIIKAVEKFGTHGEDFSYMIYLTEEDKFQLEDALKKNLKMWGLSSYDINKYNGITIVKINKEVIKESVIVLVTKEKQVIRIDKYNLRTHVKL